MHTARASPSEPVAQCSQRSIQHHAGAGPAHHTAYHLALCRRVTVSSASPARPFLLTITTPRQPQRGIIAQSDIFFGHLLQMQFMTAVQFYHHTHHPLLTFYTSVSHPIPTVCHCSNHLESYNRGNQYYYEKQPYRSHTFLEEYNAEQHRAYSTNTGPHRIGRADR